MAEPGGSATEKRSTLDRLRDEVAFWRRVRAHPGTPRRAKWLAGAALAYLASPIDLVPDFIPVLGHLDDVLVVGGLLYLALRSVPERVRVECRQAPPAEGDRGP